MQEEWEVMFSADAPTWQYGKLIEIVPGPNGSLRATLICKEVIPQEHGFVRLVVAPKHAEPERTFLVRQEYVEGAAMLDGISPRWTIPLQKKL